ncbi:MAG: penicillin-binding protein activator [Azospirillaceae bacterium]|nr:penicillin-binding protein activator [Azospirillaceae bacterium]
MARFATLARALGRFPVRLSRVCLCAGVALALTACAGPRVRPAEPPLQVPPPTASTTAPQPVPPVVAAPQAPVTVAPLTSAGSGDKLRVAILLPLSGPNAAIGNALMQSAQLALFSLADSRFELMPRDTKGTPEGASQAAQDAISGGARMLLGPLFAPEVAAVKPIAHRAGVSVLAFSTDASLAGDGTYIMGFVPDDQVRRVVSYARSQGLTRFGAVAPRNAYGEAVVAALTDAVQANRGQLVRVERYDAGPGSGPAAVQAVLSGGPGTIDAVLLPESGDKLKQLAAAFPPPAPSSQFRLLGTGLWDVPNLGREPALVGGWYAAPQPDARTEFESQYASSYGQKPPRLATLAYDAAALAAVLARSGSPDSQTFDPANLTNPNGFAGLDGIFRLRPNGTVERGLAVLAVTASGNRVIDSAPSSFVALTQ